MTTTVVQQNLKNDVRTELADQEGGCTVDEICELVGDTVPAVQEAVTALVREGHVTDSHGVYRSKG